MRTASQGRQRVGRHDHGGGAKRTPVPDPGDSSDAPRSPSTARPRVNKGSAEELVAESSQHRDDRSRTHEGLRLGAWNPTPTTASASTSAKPGTMAHRPIIDFHAHIGGDEAARLYLDAANRYESSGSSSDRLEEVPTIKRILADRVHFIASRTGRGGSTPRAWQGFRRADRKVLPNTARSLLFTPRIRDVNGNSAPGLRPMVRWHERLRWRRSCAIIFTCRPGHVVPAKYWTNPLRASPAAA